MGSVPALLLDSTAALEESHGKPEESPEQSTPFLRTRQTDIW